MNYKEFLQVIFSIDNQALQTVADKKANKIIDFTHFKLMQEIEPLLKEDLNKVKRNHLTDYLLNALVDVSIRSYEIGIDTASMLFTGEDPYSNYTKKETLSQNCSND